MNHPIAETPYQNVSADIFKWNDRDYLVTVDSYSNWFDIDCLPDMTSNPNQKSERKICYSWCTTDPDE